jgi:hypothetical protein
MDLCYQFARSQVVLRFAKDAHTSAPMFGISEGAAA